MFPKLIQNSLLVVLLFRTTAQLVAAEAGDVKAQNFSFISRMHFNSALASGVPSVNVLVATKMGRTGQAIQAFTALKGNSVERYDAVGYFWGSMPAEQVPKLVAVPDIVEFQLDGERGSLVEYYEPTDPKTLKPGSVWMRRRSRPPDPKATQLPELPAAELEKENPYLPWHLLGLSEFLRQHPTFDGRGTTVAVVSYGAGDLLHPVMREALTLDGKPIPKVAGIMNIPTTENDLYAPRIIAGELPAATPLYLELRMTDEVQSATNTVDYQNSSWVLPAPGVYKTALLDHDRRSFQVLWSPSNASVWVDTNGNHSFADETELKDINRQFSAALFPAESGDPAQALAVPSSFAVTIDEPKSLVRIFVAPNVVGDASIVAGKGFLGSSAGGVAPGARILYVQIGQSPKMTSYHQNLKAYILTGARPDVDVIEGGAYIVNPPVYGETVTSLILDRIATVYQKPIFFINGDMGGGAHVFGIRDYMSAGAWSLLYGVEAPLRDNVLEDGVETILSGITKPDFVVPDSMFATSCNVPVEAYRMATAFAKYRIPKCYGQVGSQALPVAAAAGLTAALISAAKQSGVPYDLDRIAWSLRNSAGYLDRMGSDPVGRQGYGMPDIGEAWKLLSGSEPTPAFRISSVSNGRIDDYRRAFHRGTGVNEFFGVRPGSTGSRDVTITRSSGVAAATHYRLTWRANDGTFTAPSEIELPLNQAVNVSVKYSPRSMGAHQAFLQIVDPANGIVLESFLNTVVASIPLGGNNPAVVWKPEGKGIPLGHGACLITDVQPDVPSLTFHMSQASGSALTQIFSSPLLGPEWYLRRTVDAPESHSTALDDEEDTRFALFSHPPPGPWAFCVSNALAPARSAKRTTIPYTQPEIRLETLRAGVKLKDLQTVSADVSGGINGKVEIRNEGGAMKRAALHVRLGYQEHHSKVLGPGGSAEEIDTDVVDGTQVLLFRIRGADHNVGAMVYNCAQFSSDPNIFKASGCRLQDYRQQPETIEYRLPHEGKWKLFLYSLQRGESTAPIDVDVIQIPAGDNQKPLEKIPNQDDQAGPGLAARRELMRKAEPVKIEGTQPVGPLAANADREESVHVMMTGKKAPGVPVIVTELYDLGAEVNASEFVTKMYPFDPTHSRPIALGLDVEVLPVP